MIRELAPQLADGSTVLIFPEGTRTDADKVLNSLKPGFAFIAQRAGVPIQILAIRAPRDLCPRGAPWWAAPRFPTRVDIYDAGRRPARSRPAGGRGQSPRSKRRLLRPIGKPRLMRSTTHLILIPSYNTGARLARTVADALAHWDPVWVVVDGSTDRSGGEPGGPGAARSARARDRPAPAGRQGAGDRHRPGCRSTPASPMS